jgi:lysophospholipid acyltransferase (LPLAT)-like uncharacterized protein
MASRGRAEGGRLSRRVGVAGAGPRRWHQRPSVQGVLAASIAGYIRLLEKTGRWELRCHPEAAALIRARRPFIGAFWHGRMLMICPAWRAVLAELGIAEALQPCVISSDHLDGRLMARATARFGVRTVFGSTKRGAIGLVRAALQVISQGQIAVVTPDGPRGPRMRAKPGIVRLARSTGAPVVPIAFAASNQRLLGSWDRFALALPFARGVLAFGAPMEIGKNEDSERARARVERGLTELTAELDRAVGHAPVEPAS